MTWIMGERRTHAKHNGLRVSHVRANDPGTVILDQGPTINGKTTRYGGGLRANAFGAVTRPRQILTGSTCQVDIQRRDYNANDLGVFKVMLRANSIRV